MAQCIINNAGTLEFTADPIGSCAGFVVLEPQEYSEMQFLTGAFEVPEVAQLQVLFIWAFSIVVIPFLVAWAYQTVIGWLDDELTINHNYED